MAYGKAGFLPFSLEFVEFFATLTAVFKYGFILGPADACPRLFFSDKHSVLHLMHVLDVAWESCLSAFRFEFVEHLWAIWRVLSSNMYQDMDTGWPFLVEIYHTCIHGGSCRDSLDFSFHCHLHIPLIGEIQFLLAKEKLIPFGLYALCCTWWRLRSFTQFFFFFKLVDACIQTWSN